MSTSRCIISLANNRGNYRKALERLEQSLIGKFDGDFLGFISEESIGAPLHTDNPYAFKIYAFLQAIEVGYSEILWVDSSCYAIKNVQSCFNEIEKNGYIMQEAGHMCGTWSNDVCLEYFGITRDEAMLMPMYGNAGFLGLNTESDLAMDFFKLWSQAMEAGVFKGDWSNHRHDMVCGSIIANKLGMKYKKGDEWLQYMAPTEIPANDTIIWGAQGL